MHWCVVPIQYLDLVIAYAYNIIGYMAWMLGCDRYVRCGWIYFLVANLPRNEHQELEVKEMARRENGDISVGITTMKKKKIMEFNINGHMTLRPG